MKSRTYATALVLGLSLALLVTFTPVLAHPYWGGETGEQVVPPWMGDYEDMPCWGDNEIFLMPRWYNNGTIPEGYYNEDGDAPVYPRGGYGCGASGRGYRGGSSYSPRGPTRWSG